MRSHEFVTEAITIAHFQPEFSQIIFNCIFRSLNKIQSMQGIYSDIEREANTSNDFELVYSIYINWFDRNLKIQLVNQLGYVVNALLHERYPQSSQLPGIRIKISSDITANAHVENGTTIVIGTKLVDNIVLDIKFHSKKVYEVGDNPTKAFFEIIDELNSDFGKKIFASSVNTFADTLTHEFVHVIQSVEQIIRGRDNIEYRSYLEPNKNRFYSKLSSMTSTSDAEVFKLYHASPQEITAFATNIALKILRNHNFDFFIDITEQNLRKIVGQSVRAHLKYTQDDMTGRKLQVYKRYAKRVYQILQDYIERRDREFNKTVVDNTH